MVNNFVERAYISFCRFLGRHVERKDVKVSEDFIESLDYLKWGLKPGEVVFASQLAMALVFVIFLGIMGVSYYLGRDLGFYVVCLVVVPVLVLHLISEYPKTKAKLQRMQDMCYMPSTLTKLVIALKRVPNLEQALRFAIEFEGGKIASSLRKALWDCWSGEKANLDDVIPNLADEWGEYSASLKMALYKVKAALSEKSKASRSFSLDKAMESTLAALHEQITRFVDSLMIPTLVLFTFGAVFPLVIVSVLPIISFFGFTIGTPPRISFILLLTILFLYLYSDRILQSRPPTFAPPDIPSDLPGFPKPGHLRVTLANWSIEAPAYVYPPAIFIFVGFPGIVYLLSTIEGLGIVNSPLSPFVKEFNTLSLLWAVALAIAVYYYGTNAYKEKKRGEILEMEGEFVDSLFHLGSRLGENRPPEEAIRYTAKLLPSTRVGKMYTEIYTRMHQRNLTLTEALFNMRMGVMNDVHSDLIRSTMRLFAQTAQASVSSASDMMYTIAQHFSALKKSEKEIHSLLQHKISMMKVTAVFFAPAICGLVITLQEMIKQSVGEAQGKLVDVGFGLQPLYEMAFLKAPSISSEMLLLIVGSYVLLLNLVLVRFCTIITDGNDDLKVRLDLAISLPISMAVFTLAFYVARYFLL